MRSNLIKKIIASTLIFSLTCSISMGLIQKANTAQASDWDDYFEHDYDDVEVYKGNLSIQGVTNYFGRPAVSIAIPSGLKIKDVDVENEPHDHIDENIQNGMIIIHGLRNGMTYQNLMLKLEDWSGIEYIYTINPFTVNGNINNQVPNVPQIPQVPQNNQVPNVPQIPQVPQNNQVPNNNMQQGQKPNVNHKELPGYLKNIYRNVFNREVDNDGLGYWNNKLATGQIELDDFFKNLLSEREFIETAPMVEDKIKKLYTGIFQRQPDTEGFNFWVQKYKEELKDEGNEKEALRDIIDKMTDGQEFRELLVKLGLNDN